MSQALPLTLSAGVQTPTHSGSIKGWESNIFVSREMILPQRQRQHHRFETKDGGGGRGGGFSRTRVLSMLSNKVTNSANKGQVESDNACGTAPASPSRRSELGTTGGAGLGLRRRSVSFLDGFGASIDRSVQFGMDTPPPTSNVYRHLYSREDSGTQHENAGGPANGLFGMEQSAEHGANNHFNNAGFGSAGTRQTSSSQPSPHQHQQHQYQQQLSSSPNTPYEQAQLLLVSLLENFCALYDRNPDKNRRLFMAVCRQLWNMGILTSADFFNRSEKLRGVYKEAFRTLVLEAIQGIEATEPDGSRLLVDPNLEDEDPEEEGDALSSSISRSISLIRSSRNSSPASTKGPFEVRPIASRLETEFRNLTPIGRGGFAQVFRGEHRIDHCQYAFKRIEFTSKNSETYEKIIREIKSLAHLEHPYIVRYHGAWIEERCTEERTKTQQHRRRHSDINVDVSSMAPQSFTGTTLSAGGGGHRNQQHQTANGIAIPIGNHDVPDFECEIMSSGYFMFIQMELCQFTLADWLEQRNFLICHHKPWLPEYSHRHSRSRPLIPIERMATLVGPQTWDINPTENCRIFKCIVKALQHIHCKGIIHRDLKPGNILFQVDDDYYIPKIGDFGLASDMGFESETDHHQPLMESRSLSYRGKSPLPSPSSASRSTRTTGIGTCMVSCLLSG